MAVNNKANNSYPTDEKTTAQVLLGGDSPELDKASATSGSFYTLVRTMRKHPTIALARQLSIAPVLAAGWSVIEKEGAPEGAREFIDSQIMPQRIHLLKSAMHGCTDFGWQGYEKVFQPGAISGKIELRKVKPLLQDKTKILIDPANGSYAGLLNSTTKEVTLGIPESLLVNFDVEGTDWYGTAIMSIVKKAYDEWNITNNANVKYDKKIAGAHWIIHYPTGKSKVNGVDTDNFELAKQLLVQLESSGSFVVPRQIENFVDDLNKDAKAWDIELKSAYPTSNVAFIDRLKYLDAMMVRAFGLPERALLEGQFGTKAEAEAHADFAITNMELRHQIIVQQFNWHLVNQLMRINYGEETEGLICIEVSPITDLTLQFTREVYKLFLSSPESFANEMQNIDTKAMRDKLGVPTITDAAALDQNNANIGLLSFVRGALQA